jgi:pimeloyl-ACP methyl ester carboxylesterase
MAEKRDSDRSPATRRDVLKTGALVAGAGLAANLGILSDLHANDLVAKPGWSFMEPTGPPAPEEHCNPNENMLDGFFTPAPFLVEAQNEDRLIWPLRAAVGRSVATMLSLSAAAFALARASTVSLPGPPPSQPVPANGDPIGILHGGLGLLHVKASDVVNDRNALATAFADLAVSGSRAFAEFKKAPPAEPAVANLATKLLHGLGGIEANSIAQGAKQSLARASQVAAYLSAIVPDPLKRRGLNWIAVSGEDDQAHRPVNIPSLPFPQYNIMVPVRAPNGTTVHVNTRYAIASTKPQATPHPHIPASDVVLLFIHGDSSRLEEARPLIQPLLAAGARHGTSYTIIAMDLPSHGCTTMVDPLGPYFVGTPPWDNHAPKPPGRPSSYPVLEFLENFILSFVAALERTLGISKQLLGPMGGSLGGNLCLRLARKTEPWIKQSIAWSPASVWDSLADDLVKQAGPNHCSTEGHKPEVAGTRAAFFKDQFDSSTNIGPINILLPQGEYWYRDDWRPCKGKMLQAARVERRELYNRIFRQWHYRMDWEQLIYSYNDADHGSREPRWKSFQTHLLLASGSEDNKSKCTQIYSSAQKLAHEIGTTNARGRTFFIEHTGHSIHDERPILWAAQIDAFCAETLGGLHEWANAAGTPLIRFTGSVHEKKIPCSATGADVGKSVLQLILTVQTGDDDIRGGSKPQDNADVILHLHSGQPITIHNINQGKHWNNNEVHSVQLFLPANHRLKVGDIESLTLRTQFGGGIGGDNWNVNHVLLRGVVAEK